ncbi:hypothetical protein RS86_03816 [Microbacterium azadirachtae]|uniref:DNA uptake lipoprotein n=2 Tax=Microbacterium azadirachtae TaxID=582680 RepID=A0A0F0LH58_9MICO|nr:hypothetical protein RS86_03816 [Microbacterium azadirachtae]
MSTARPSTPSDSAPQPEGSSVAPPRPRMRGVGRVLVIVYAVMALGATGRSFVQIARAFDEAPLAYSLSAASAVVYIVATLALIGSGRPGWYRVAWVAIVFEMVGVLVVGTLSLTHPALFQHQTVWSQYGLGYVLIPLFLPMVGLWWLVTHRPARTAPAVTDGTASSNGSAA